MAGRVAHIDVANELDSGGNHPQIAEAGQVNLHATQMNRSIPTLCVCHSWIISEWVATDMR